MKRAILLLVLIPFLSACGAADANAPCTDLEVRQAAMRNLAATLVGDAMGDPNRQVVVHDDRYVVHIPRQHRRAAGIDSVVIAYTLDATAELALVWPKETGISDMQMTLSHARKVSGSGNDAAVVACEGEVVVNAYGDIVDDAPITFRVQRQDDGRLSVSGEFGPTTFQSPTASP
jgi:hypothetical protein